MTENQPTDYAAIVRAATEIVPSPPDWLKVGQHIYSAQQGIGEVIALLGYNEPRHYGPPFIYIVVCGTKKVGGLKVCP